MTASQTSVTYGTQRRAAARNRAAILEVAHDLLAESAAVSMNEIAKRAGVGAGTLYRHFPTREDLILAVYRHDVQKLVDSVDESSPLIRRWRRSPPGSRNSPPTSGSSTVSGKPCTTPRFRTPLTRPTPPSSPP